MIDYSKDIVIKRTIDTAKAIRFTDETQEELYKRGLVGFNESQNINMLFVNTFHPFYGIAVHSSEPIEKGEWIVYDEYSNVTNGKSSIFKLSNEEFTKRYLINNGD